MKSSSMPPAVVTMHDTCLCSTRYRKIPRSPDEIILDVYPRKMVVLSPVSGSCHDRFYCCQLSYMMIKTLHLLTMSLMIRTASPMEVAWNPMRLMRWITSSTVICFPLNSLKSISSTFCAPCGSSTDGTKTAFVASEGGKLEFELELVMILIPSQS